MANDAALPDTHARWIDLVSAQLMQLDAWAPRDSAAARAWAAGAPADYRAGRTPEQAVRDICLCAGTGSPVEVTSSEGVLTVRLAWTTRPALSHVIGVLLRLGVAVDTHESWTMSGPTGERCTVDQFVTDAARSTDPPGLTERLAQAIDAVLKGWVDDDGFNCLVTDANLTWRQVSWVRAWYRYLRQTGLSLDLLSAQAAVRANPGPARALVDLFTARLAPGDERREQRVMAADRTALDELATVRDRDQGRILRAGRTLVHAVTRTSAFLDARGPRGAPRLTLKIDPTHLSWAPRPRPHRETFVHSTAVEGLHLRGTAVSRGGLRFSDRPDDLRTEVLGLMKAQQVKNAVIVPGGAKGGFVLRPGRPGADVHVAYAEFVRGLLDITDNIVEGTVVHPDGVVCLDGDDAYLVVAADKGTATFSDVANVISAEYAYWLGDAFASGGSTGFDHKKMGITARGAWRSLERHLGETGLNPAFEPFTMAGIGDMSGDVFGNGVLLAPQARLIAAFDHRHVFIDPDPDPATSWSERRRLASMLESSWDDYDRTLLSAGGAIVSRDKRDIVLSPEARSALGITTDPSSVDDLVRAVLRAPVDVLFNGGVGTYVKASSQTQAEAGDPLRDLLRIDASELRAGIVVEGGNLGLTQAARIEFALAGGRINTDFLDNSAGVNTSDREVNLKIALDAEVAARRLTDIQRNDLLRNAAGFVAAQVLTDSAAQARAVSIAEYEAPALLDRHRQLVRVLHDQHKLDPEVEDLPDETGFDSRRAAGSGLTRPELAVLLAYSKDVVRDALLHSSVLGQDHFAPVGRTYLPPAIAAALTEPFENHPLHRDILATIVANEIVNRVGSSFIDRLEELTGFDTSEVVSALAVVTSALGLDEVWREIEELPSNLSGVQTTMLIALRKLVESECLWLLRHSTHPIEISTEVARFAQAAATTTGFDEMACTQHSHGDAGSAAARFEAAGAPTRIARRVAALAAPFPILAVVDLANELEVPAGRVACTYLHMAEQLHWTDLVERIEARSSDHHLRHVACAATRLATEQHAIDLVARFLSDAARPDDVASWLQRRNPSVRNYLTSLNLVRGSTDLDFTSLVVAAHELSIIAGAQPREQS